MFVCNYNIEIRSKNDVMRHLSSFEEMLTIDPRFANGSYVNTLIVTAHTSVVCLRFR